ncbi:universal stress protein [Desulfurococcus amylolyticus]|uniref:universal stress protein n=1 Tax=Desulfurococcus amylolyticus TaxID=94694 RepID=UPI0005B1F4B7|nr:universal stress protein [Desulfurococcus amylolyticus]
MSEAPTYEISFYFRKILVPVDGSENSLKALEFAIDLARHYGSKIIVVYAKPKGDLRGDPFERVKLRAAKEGMDIQYKLIEYDPSSSNTPSVLVREVIEGGYDAVVVGARGLSLSTEIPIGSTALSLVINSPVSVFIVR